ncbi:MAG: preprotein translocase subunit SecG [Firmicutes bacterium]|nr:preprotein translocase subunit SecG [Bacillota bacterium]
METVLMVLQLIVSLGLIVAIVLQESKGEGLGSIGGGAQMFFDKPTRLEATLEKATTTLAVLFLLLTIILLII